jgi:hypothetical protein
MTDDIAERVRKIGGVTIRSIGHIARLQRLSDNDADYVDPPDMLAELREDNPAHCSPACGKLTTFATKRTTSLPAGSACWSLDRRDGTAHLVPLRNRAAGLPNLPLGESRDLHQGQLVMAFGSPLGLENSASLGVISAVARQLKQDSPMIYIQTDASINPGNSGGPLVDMSGRVIGLNTLILSESGGSEGIGFAIPSDTLRNVYNQIRKEGHVHRGQIGVSVETITPVLATGLGLNQDWGVLVADVTPDGPAYKAGLQPGDIVLN